MKLSSHTKFIAFVAGAILAVGALVWWRGFQDEAVVNTFMPEVHIPVQRAFLNSSLSQEERLENLSEEVKNFPPQELHDWISQINPGASLTPAQDRDFVIFNEVLVLYRSQPEFSPSLVDFLSELLTAADLHSVVRDYAAQHLVLYIQAHPDQQESQKLALDTLIKTIMNKEIVATSIPGTIVNALTGFQNQGGTLSPEQLQRLSTAKTHFLSSEGVPLSLRVSFVQSIKHSVDLSENESHRHLLRSLLEDEHLPEALAMASCAALAQVGTSEDLTLLNRLAHRRTLVSHAAKTAVKKISQRKRKTTLK